MTGVYTASTLDRDNFDLKKLKVSHKSGMCSQYELTSVINDNIFNMEKTKLESMV